MTVMSIYAPVNRMGNGATVIFAFPYQFFAPTDLKVTLFDLVANAPVSPPPVLNGSGGFNYTVTGTVDTLGTGEYLNGSVTFNTAPPANVQVTIERAIAPFQPVALADDSLFPAKTVEAEFDRLQMQIQQNAAWLSRAITVPASDPPLDLELPPAALRAGKLFGFDGAGSPETHLVSQQVEAALAAFLSGAAPQIAAGWARTLALATVLYPASAVLADGHVMAVDGRFAVNDGYGGIFAYAAGDTTTVFANSGLGFVDAAGRRWKRIVRGDAILATWFTTGGDATAALQAACNVLQINGGGRLVFPPGTYNVTANLAAPLFSFSNLNGVTIECMDGATIADQLVYAGTDSAELFCFFGCRNVHLRLRVTSQIAVTTAAALVRGLRAVVLRQGCCGVRIALDMTGGIGGLRIDRLNTDPVSYSSRDISGRIVASGCFYPYVGSYGGDNVTIDLDTDTCGRGFFIYGCKSVRINWACKNLQVTSLIKAYQGLGCEDVRVALIDRDSTANLSGAPRISLHYGDSTAAVHRNIALHMNTKNPSSSPWGNTIGMAKYSDGGGLADTTGRGHLLEGFAVTGVMDSTGCPTNHFNMEDGAFATPDAQRNIRISDVTALGVGRAFSVPLNVLGGAAHFDNVICEGGIYTANVGGVVIFDGCVAQNFTASNTQNMSHHYRACSITDGTLQNYADNKEFLITATPNTIRKSGIVAFEAQKMLSGDLTVTRNIFRIGTTGTGYRCRLEYYLTANNGELDPSFRAEVFGIKNFTILTNGVGGGSLGTPIVDEVTQRGIGTASVPTFSFVAGDANYWHIAFSCTNYSNAAARGVFRLSVLAASAASGAMWV